MNSCDDNRHLSWNESGHRTTRCQEVLVSYGFALFSLLGIIVRRNRQEKGMRLTKTTQIGIYILVLFSLKSAVFFKKYDINKFRFSKFTFYLLIFLIKVLVERFTSMKMETGTLISPFWTWTQFPENLG